MYSENQIKELALEKIESTQELKVFENIVDKDGHKRFIEVELDLVNTAPAGVTKTFGKCSLSGTHLLIVLACDVADTTVVSGKLCEINVPQWIKDKIIPLGGNLVDFKGSLRAWDDAGNTSQYYDAYLMKTSEDVFYISCYITATADRHFRIEFDLLIDNE